MPLTTLFTIGHGDRPLTLFLAVLSEVHVDTLVDVRAWPRSQRHPHFDSDRLRDALEQNGMSYHWAGRQLGGKRDPRASSRHTGLADEGLRGYADHMETDPFQRAATQLMRSAGQARVAVMCAERAPEHCHRALLSDYLTLKGLQVVHLLELGERCDHLLSATLRRETDQPVYDRNCCGSLDLK